MHMYTFVLCTIRSSVFSGRIYIYYIILYHPDLIYTTPVVLPSYYYNTLSYNITIWYNIIFSPFIFIFSIMYINVYIIYGWILCASIILCIYYNMYTGALVEPYVHRRCVCVGDYQIEILRFRSSLSDCAV